MSIDGRLVNAAAINQGGGLGQSATAVTSAAATLIAAATYVWVAAVPLVPATASLESSTNQTFSVASASTARASFTLADADAEKLATANGFAGATIVAPGTNSTDLGFLSCTASLLATPTQKLPGASLLGADSTAISAAPNAVAIADTGMFSSSRLDADPGLLENGSSTYIWNVSCNMPANAGIDIAANGAKIVTQDGALSCNALIEATLSYHYRNSLVMQAGVEISARPISNFNGVAGLASGASMVVEPGKKSVALSSIEAGAEMSASAKKMASSASKQEANAGIDIAPVVIHFHGYPKAFAGAVLSAEISFFRSGSSVVIASASIDGAGYVSKYADANAGASSTMVVDGYIHVPDAIVFERTAEVRDFSRPVDQRTFIRPAT
jgi:hypothetical protein